MKKLSLLAFVSLGLVVGASAQAKPKAPAKPVKKISCAVEQGDPVDIAEATKKHMYADYKGRRYFFCCAGCPEEFSKNPAKYAKKAQSIPTPKSKK